MTTPKKKAKKKSVESSPVHQDTRTAEAVPQTPIDLRAAIEKALGDKLREIVSGPLTPTSLLALQKAADNARRIFDTLQLDAASNAPGSGITYNPDTLGTDPVALGSPILSIGGFGGSGGTLAPSASAENFGTKAMRELIAIISKANAPKPPSTLDLLTSMSMAKSHGMHKLAAKIKKQLNSQEVVGGSKETFGTNVAEGITKGLPAGIAVAMTGTGNNSVSYENELLLE